MADILGLTPPAEQQGPDTMSASVARDIQRDAMELARRDAWFSGLIGIGFLVGTVVMIWLSRQRPLLLSMELRPPLPWQFGFFSALAFLSAYDALRAYRRMRAAAGAGSAEVVDFNAPGTRMVFERHWMSRRSRQIILGLLLLGVAFQFYDRSRPIAGPIVFLNATIRTGTGFAQQNMTVAVADGRVAFVGTADDALPAALSGARRLDARTAMVSAATFDHSVSRPLDALRHIWAGQLYEGAPGDLVVSTFTPFRGRNRTAEPRDVLGAVVNGRYYSAAELQKK